jgi:hypothetical protein
MHAARFECPVIVGVLQFAVHINDTTPCRTLNAVCHNHVLLLSTPWWPQHESLTGPHRCMLLV